MRFITTVGLACIGLLCGTAGWAGPWIAPGDSALRHDIQVLADAGVITSPVSTWPLSTGDIAASLDIARPAALTDYEMAALQRVRRRLQTGMNMDRMGWNVDASVAAHPRLIRTFEDGPREDAELGVGIEWTGKRFATSLQGQWVADPSDGDEWRADQSYAGVALGNWMLAAAITDRWWGPGWQGSLIMSNNARPIPAITLERNSTAPFETKWLSWLGSWDLMVMYGFLESNRAVPNAHFFGLRFNFKPLRNLEIGFSRTAMYCGDTQPCGLDAFLDMLIRDDDDSASIAKSNPNQLGGFDVRWSHAMFGQPFALYTQWIGEDENGFLPTQWMGQFGGEIWGNFGGLGSYRAFLEWTDSTCDFTLYRNIRGDHDPANGGCAYNHNTYTTGYRYRGRAIGHSTDSDSSVFTLGWLLNDNDDRSWLATVAIGNLNRHTTSTPSTVAPHKTRYREVELVHRRTLWVGDLDVGLGYDYRKDAVTDVSNGEVRAFLEWGVKY